MSQPRPLGLSNTVQSIPPSAIRRFFDLANELKGQVISLSIGEPDFLTPWTVTEAGIYSLEQGMTHYSPNQGYIELRSLISNYLAQRYGVTYAPETEVLCTVGGSEAIDITVRALVDPGDEVLIPEPCFVAYKACTLLAGGQPVPIATIPEEGFKLTPERLEAAITERTKLLILGYPNNPTGAIMTRKDWEAVAAVLERHPGLFVLTDELYTELDYSGYEPSSLIQFASLRDRVFYVGGFSKSFAMTGWRIGYVVAPAPYIAAVNKIHQYIIMSAPSTAQYAAMEALKRGYEAVETMREAYNQRRRLVVKALETMGLETFVPEGAFYAFPCIKRTGLTSTEFCERFLAEHRVAIVPGSAFGESGEGYARISYAASIENIEEAMRRLKIFVESLGITGREEKGRS